MKFSHTKECILLLTTCLVGVGHAFAQEQVEPAEPAAQVEQEPAEATNVLSTIVVTANRREENLQQVPIAVSAVTPELAAKMGVTDLASMTDVIPGFTFNRQSGGSQPFVRGVANQSTTVGNEPSVAIFVDDIYIPTANAAMFDFNNISLVEVLKGPQGTLFGRNATGGVIHLHTTNPEFDEVTGDVEVGYATYNKATAKAFLNTPINDKIALNFAGYYNNQQDGWGNDVYSGEDIFKREGWGLRSKALIEFTPDTDLLLTASYNFQEGDEGNAQRTVMGFAGRAGITPEEAGAGFYDGMVERPSTYQSKFTILSAKLTHDFGPVNLVSITGYTDSKNPVFQDISAYRGNLSADYDQNEEAYTQEIQLLSPEGGRLNWIVGGFYMHDTALFDGFFYSLGPAAGTDTGGMNLGPALPPGLYSSSHAELTTDSFSVFGETTYDLTDRMSVTAGLRYTSDDRSVDKNGGEFGVLENGVPGPVVLQASGPFPDSEKFDKMTGRFAIDYDVTQDFMVYAAYNRGFKSGVYSSSSYNVQSTGVVPAVRPEEIDAYSGGFKSEFLDNRARLNVEGFYYEIKNIQVQNNLAGQPGTEIRNGGKASLQGIEADLTLQATDNLTLSAAVSIVDGSYDEFNNGPTYFPQAPNPQLAIPDTCSANPSIYPGDGSGPIYPTTNAAPLLAVPGGCNLAGNDMLQVIPFSSQISAIYTVPLPNGSIDMSVNWLHTDSYFFEPDNNPYVEQDPVDKVNASITWNNEEDNFDLRFWMNNILGEEYYTYIANSGTSGVKGSPAAPRTYGMTLGYHF